MITYAGWLPARAERSVIVCQAVSAAQAEASEGVRLLLVVRGVADGPPVLGARACPHQPLGPLVLQ